MNEQTLKPNALKSIELFRVLEVVNQIEINGIKKTFKVASNDQKVTLPQQRSRGQSRQVETTKIVSDATNENAQIILTNSPKPTASSSVIPSQNLNIVKTVTPPSTSVSQSTSGVMTGVNLILNKPFYFWFNQVFPLFFCATLCRFFTSWIGFASGKGNLKVSLEKLMLKFNLSEEISLESLWKEKKKNFWLSEHSKTPFGKGKHETLIDTQPCEFKTSFHDTHLAINSLR